MWMGRSWPIKARCLETTPPSQFIRQGPPLSPFEDAFGGRAVSASARDILDKRPGAHASIFRISGRQRIEERYCLVSAHVSAPIESTEEVESSRELLQYLWTPVPPGDLLKSARYHHSLYAD